MPNRHKQQRTERGGVRDDEILFVATCSCGWRGDPVPAVRVVAEWERHFDEAKRALDPPDSPS